MTKTPRRAESPVFPFVLGLTFLFVGWYQLEDRIIAPLRLSKDRAESFDATLIRVVDTPDRKVSTGADGRGYGWELVPGVHVLYFEGFGPIEYPRALGASMRKLQLNTSYQVEAQPWGTYYWRVARDTLPFKIVRIFNSEDRSDPGHRVLISLKQGGETLVESQTAVSMARKGMIFGAFVSAFFLGFGVLIMFGWLLMLTGRS